MEPGAIGQRVRLKADEPSYKGLEPGDVVVVDSVERYGFIARREDGYLITGCGWSAWEPALLDTHSAVCTTDERVIMTAPVSGWYELPGSDKEIYLEAGAQIIKHRDKPVMTGTVRTKQI